MNQVHMHSELSLTGQRLLSRRGLIGDAANGLAGIALASLLGSGARAATPLRPDIRTERPLAARNPHFAPKAKRVLVLFCSGALSHLESFDWKPELVRMNGQPMPGSPEKLITFQGETGKMISDLLPNLAELADDLCFIHSMTAKSNTHGPAENQMSTGFIFDGF